MPDTTETLKGRIASFVNDVATLDVITLTGDIKLITPEYNAADKKFNWDTLFTNIAAKMKADNASELQILAYTHSEFDHDSVNFVRKDITPEQQFLLASHNAAVEAAQKSRFEAVKIIAGLVGVSFK